MVSKDQARRMHLRSSVVAFILLSAVPDLLNDDLSDDVRCAKKVYGRHGFRAWYGWRNKCDGKTLPNISDC